MSDNRHETRALLMMIMLAFWAGAFGYSILYFFNGGVQNDGPMAGLSQGVGFLGWQGVAAMFAMASFGIGRSFPKDSGIRKVSSLPLGFAVVLFLVVSAMFVLG
jgi:hypothetical protein